MTLQEFLEYYDYSYDILFENGKHFIKITDEIVESEIENERFELSSQGMKDIIKRLDGNYYELFDCICTVEFGKNDSKGITREEVYQLAKDKKILSTYTMLPIIMGDEEIEIPKLESED